MVFLLSDTLQRLTFKLTVKGRARPSWRSAKEFSASKVFCKIELGLL